MSDPFALVAIHGLSAHVPPEICTAGDHVAPWSFELENTMWFWRMKVAKTAPLEATASVMSNWPWLAQLVQSAFDGPQVVPPSLDTRTAMYGFGYCIQAA